MRVASNALDRGVTAAVPDLRSFDCSSSTRRRNARSSRTFCFAVRGEGMGTVSGRGEEMVLMALEIASDSLMVHSNEAATGRILD